MRRIKELVQMRGQYWEKQDQLPTNKSAIS
jgi:hypothetical protein